MAKIVISKITEAVTEGVLRQLMPRLDETLAAMKKEIQSVRDDIRSLDAKVDNLRTEMLERFESMLATVNEVSHRVTRLDGKLEGYMEAMGIRLQVDEVERKGRKRRAS